MSKTTRHQFNITCIVMIVATSAGFGGSVINGNPLAMSGWFIALATWIALSALNSSRP